MGNIFEFEQIRTFLPQYLTAADQGRLFQELKSFPENFTYYSQATDIGDEILQGDGWRGFVVIDFLTTEKKNVSGIVLSNSCDLSLSNERAQPPRIVFAPMIQLQPFRDTLRAAGKTDRQIDSLCESIAAQKVTSIFYLPPVPGLMGESIALLDDIHSHPSTDFRRRKRSRLFTLSQAGFYLFVIKLSIHFTRINEGMVRSY
jgi:hypothetical protein